MPNICRCPQPPGGLVICENNQLALCIIENGEAIQRCMNPPQNRYYANYNALNLVNWTIEAITQRPRGWDKFIEKYEIEMLRSGIYQAENLKILFTLTDRIKAAVDKVENGLRNNHNDDNRFQ